jgi:ubiquinone/menaquinone biosynthesis C-methylase UbiE
LARRGADVVGVDISGALVDRARRREASEPLGIAYVHADITSHNALGGRQFDIAMCSFGLSDIDDLDAALTTVVGALTPHGRFVFSMLHPCFAGGAMVAGSWPTDGGYADEGRWTPTNTASTLRRQVGTTHRTLSTYLNALSTAGLHITQLAEPAPPDTWTSLHRDAARQPVFLVATCHRSAGVLTRPASAIT